MRTLKRVLYRIFQTVCTVLAVAGTILLAYFAAPKPESGKWIVAAVYAVTLIFFPCDVLVHEVGHLIFGFAAGMKFSSVSAGCFRLSLAGKRFRLIRGRSYAGASEMYPKDGRHTRGRVICFTLGGGLLNLIFGGVFLYLYFFVPQSLGLLFFELAAPLNLLQGILSLCPAEYGGGTDGAFLNALLKKTAQADVCLRVFQIQGVLSKSTFAAVPHTLLFDAPVVREDNPAFAALTLLQYQYLCDKGEFSNALEKLGRLQNLTEYLPPEARAEVACEVVFSACILFPDREKAEAFFSMTDPAKGTPAYIRAEAAYQKRVLPDWKTEKCLRQCHMAGVREYERRQFLLLEKFLGGGVVETDEVKKRYP